MSTLLARRYAVGCEVWEHFEAAHELAKENRLRNVALVQVQRERYRERF